MPIQEVTSFKQILSDYVNNNLLDKNGLLSSMKITKELNFKNQMLEEVTKHTQFLDDTASIPERIFCILNDVVEKKMCMCGKRIEFLSNIKGYRKACRRCFRKMLPNFKTDGLGLVNYKNNIKKTFAEFLKEPNQEIVPKEEVVNFIKTRVEAMKINMANESRSCRMFFRTSDLQDHKNMLRSIIEYTNYMELDHSNYKFSQRIYDILNDIRGKKCEICKIENTSFRNFFLGYYKVCVVNKCAYALASDIYTANHNKIIRKRLEEQGFEMLDKNPLIRIGNNKINLKCKNCNGIFLRDISDGDWKHIVCRGCYLAHGISHEEKSVLNFIKEIYINENILENQRLFDDSKREIDIFIPSKNLAIEYNGSAWHSFGSNFPDNFHLESKRKFEHFKKYNLTKDKNIQLLQICSTEWMNLTKKEIWKSILRSKMGLCTKIHARQCDIVELSETDKNDFLNNNHMLGMDNSKIKLGLIYNNELLFVMTFGKPRFNKNYEWEMLRFCSKIHTTVVGGASKLLKSFIKKYNPKNILSYADMRYSNGSSYKNIGFNYVKNTTPSYCYVRKEKRISRFSAQKHNQPKFLENFDKNKTEVQNMMDNDYRRIWDCGMMLFAWNS